MIATSDEDLREATWTLCYSIETLHILPRHILDPATDGNIRNACIESFYVNIRLLIEFLTRQNQKDINSRLFCENWPPPGYEKRGLGSIWETASQHVVHLSTHRLSSRQGSMRVANFNDFLAHSRLALLALRNFAEQIPDSSPALWSARRSLLEATTHAQNAVSKMSRTTRL